MKNLWIFGCSFSSGYLKVPREKSYGNLIAGEMGFNIVNLANAGRSNDMLFYELMSNVNNIKEDDYIIFQFSSFDRIGHFVDDNLHSYFSSAGLPQLGIDHKMNEEPFKNFSKQELKILLDYIIEWHPRTWKFEIDNTINLLNYLKSTKNINYSLLYMLNEYQVINENVIKLPTNTNKNNISIHDFLMENKLTISDEFPDEYTYFDSHPGFGGHEKLKEIILEKI
jgi:hypothetical protein